MRFLRILGYQSAKSSRFGLSQNFYLIIIEIDLDGGYFGKLRPSKLIHLSSLLYTNHLILLSIIWGEPFVPNKRTTPFMHELHDQMWFAKQPSNLMLWCHNTCNAWGGISNILTGACPKISQRHRFCTNYCTYNLEYVVNNLQLSTVKEGLKSFRREAGEKPLIEVRKRARDTYKAK